jgi:hypothetical protein
LPGLWHRLAPPLSEQVRTPAAEAPGAAAIAAAAAPASNNGAIESSLILIVKILCVRIVCLVEFWFPVAWCAAPIGIFSSFSIISSEGELALFVSRSTAAPIQGCFFQLSIYERMKPASLASYQTQIPNQPSRANAWSRANPVWRRAYGPRLNEEIGDDDGGGVVEVPGEASAEAIRAGMLRGERSREHVEGHSQIGETSPGPTTSSR